MPLFNILMISDNKIPKYKNGPRQESGTPLPVSKVLGTENSSLLANSRAVRENDRLFVYSSIHLLRSLIVFCEMSNFLDHCSIFYRRLHRFLGK